MSKSPALSYVGTGIGSVHSHTLLTPPLSPASSEDIPYKPGDDDVTSLSMKKRHKQPQSRERRRLNRACASSTELRASAVDQDAFPIRKPSHFSSLPQLTVQQSSPMLKPTTSQAQGIDHRDSRKRRWTLPSKAASTQGQADKISVVKKPNTTSNAAGDSQSPAMITLRRASTSRPKKSRKMSLTFFPPPKFERSRSGLLTAFLDTLTGREEPERAPTWTEQFFAQDRRVSVVSVKTGVPEVARKASAQPLLTKVSGMPPSLLQPVQTICDAPVRRCSTKYISSGSVYEVIWDENISSSSSELTPPSSVADGRRRSIAMDKLETQLFRAVAQSRRESAAAVDQTQHRQSRASSLSSMLSTRLTWSTEPGSVSFPVSATAGSRPALAVPTLSESRLASQPASNEADLEFFPPLRSRATTGASQISQSSQQAVDIPRIDSLECAAA